MLILQRTRFQDMLIQTADRTQHTHHQLRAAHLHRKHGYRQFTFHCNMLGNIDGKCCFTHRRATGHNNQISRLQTGGFLIQVDKSGRNPGYFVRIVARIKHVNAFDNFFQQIRQFQKTLFRLGCAFCNLENFVFRFVQQLSCVFSLRIIGISSNFRADFSQLPHYGLLPHDFGITSDICGRRSILCQCNQIIEAAHRFQLVISLQPLLNGNDVRRATFVN